MNLHFFFILKKIGGGGVEKYACFKSQVKQNRGQKTAGESPQGTATIK